ncbi:unnamed protein product [Malus baccata var. baccata]
MTEQKKKDQVMAVRSLIKRLLVYGKGRRQERELLDKEEQEWKEEASTSQHGNKEESCKEELDRVIQMAECIYDLDEPDDLPESLKLVKFLCTEQDKPPPEVQNPLEVIDLGTDEDLRPIQISGSLGVEDRARIICLLQEFKYCFAWHYTEMSGLDPALVEHIMPIKEGYKPVKQAPRRMSKEIEEKVKEEIERLNAGATYQRAMNAIFHDLIGHSMEVYIDDIVVKSKTEEQHLVDLKQLTRMRVHKLKMNPKKCAFGGPTHQQAFDSIKAYLTSPPVLVPPQRGKPLKLYISASERSIGSLLAQNNEGGKEQAVYYLSRILTEVETRYSLVERLCLALYFTASKLRHYMLPCHVHIIAKTDVIKYMLSKPMLAGIIGKWILALSEFSFQYVPQRAVKGQPIADFLTKHQEFQSEVINIPESLEVTSVWIPPRNDVSGKEDWIQQEIRKVTGLWITHWKLYFDGSRTQKVARAGIVIINPQGVYHYYSFLLDYQENTNNRAEYEALIISLEILMDLGAAKVEIFGDSELVINQLNGEFKCRHITMAGGFSLNMMVLETKMEDWRSPIIHHLKDPFSPTKASNKIMVNIIKRMVIDSPERWHEMLRNTLWAYITSKRAGTGTTPYALTFGQDAVLPMEINVSSVRIQNQFGLHSAEYIEAMCQGIEDPDAVRIEALNQIQEGKTAVARAYNKKVKIKSFKEGDLVWKTVIPLGAQLRGFGKWSPTWEGPFIISRVLNKGGYYLADLEGNGQKHPINVRFLKKYCPTLWDVRDCYIEDGAK